MTSIFITHHQIDTKQALSTLQRVVLFMIISLVSFSCFSLMNTKAHAQQDVEAIIEQIFKSGKFPKTGQEFPIPEHPNSEKPGQFKGGRIDNIPVEVRFDASNHTIPEDAILIATAYAPAPVNVRLSKPKILGETKILLADLASPVQVIIAAPATITQPLEYARVEAKIVDGLGRDLFVLANPGRFDGFDAPVLTLNHVNGALTTTPAPPTGKSKDVLSSENVRVRVKLNGPAPQFHGANLIARLTEDGLAGGNSTVIVGEARQMLDGKRQPFNIELTHVKHSDNSEIPLVLEVWVEDWAGRKTHVTPSPRSYVGPKNKYHIRLDAIGPQPYNPIPNVPVMAPAPKPLTKPKTKPVSNTKPKTKPKFKPLPKSQKNTTTKPIKKAAQKPVAIQTQLPKPSPKIEQKPKQAQKPSPAVIKPSPKPSPAPTKASKPLHQTINGQARFKAYKGLPKGAVLVVRLERLTGDARPKLLASTMVPLDGLSGHINFKLTANTTDVTKSGPPAKLRVRIEDKEGRLFFSNPGGTNLRAGFNAVNLRTSPNY